MSDNDADPNSVFTRTLLAEMEIPGQSMMQIAKKTQAKVRALAAKVDHVQVPAYYDQIVGDLSPEGAASGEGKISGLQEGGGESAAEAGAEGRGANAGGGSAALPASRGRIAAGW